MFSRASELMLIDVEVLMMYISLRNDREMRAWRGGLILGPQFGMRHEADYISMESTLLLKKKKKKKIEQ